MRLKRSQIDFARTNAVAINCLGAICARILPDGRRQGNEWIARNPRRDDRAPGSFKINLRSGLWADFATGDRGGDPVSLVAYLENVSQQRAARLLAQLLGLSEQKQ